jgi:hypothetical protein
MKNDTALGRSLRVFGYQVVILLLSLLIDPSFVKNVTEVYPQLTTFFLLGAPILSGIYNLLRSDVKNV